MIDWLGLGLYVLIGAIIGHLLGRAIAPWIPSTWSRLASWVRQQRRRWRERRLSDFERTLTMLRHARTNAYLANRRPVRWEVGAIAFEQFRLGAGTDQFPSWSAAAADRLWGMPIVQLTNAEAPWRVVAKTSGSAYWVAKAADVAAAPGDETPWKIHDDTWVALQPISPPAFAIANLFQVPPSLLGLGLGTPAPLPPVEKVTSDLTQIRADLDAYRAAHPELHKVDQYKDIGGLFFSVSAVQAAQSFEAAFAAITSLTDEADTVEETTP